MAAGGIVEIEVVPDVSKFPGKLQAGLQASTGIASTIGKGLGLAIAAGTVAAAAGFSQVIKIGNEYQAKLNEIQAVSGATGDTMAKVGARAKDLGSDMSLSGVSAADAAGAMLELAKGGLTVDQAMTAAKGTLQLAGAAQIEGARAAEIQSQTLNQFALSADNAGRVADTLANTANAASGGVEDIALAMKYVGPVAASMSISLEDTATSIGLLANNGIMADTAGTSLRGMLVSLAAPSGTAKKGIAALGIQAFDSSGKFVGMRSVIDQLSVAQGRMTEQQFAAAAAMAFGREPLAAITALAREGGPAFDEMRVAVGKQGGAAEVAAAKMKGLGGAMEGFKSNLETVAISVYELIDGPLEQFVRFATSGLDVLNDALSGGLDVSKFGALNSVVETGKGLWENFGGILRNVRDFAAPVATGLKSIFDSVSSGNGLLSIAADGVGLLGDGLELLSNVLPPIGSALGGLLRVIGGLPGPVQTALLALAGFKLLPKLIDTSSESTSRFGQAINNVKTNGVVTGLRGFSDEMRVQQALAAANGESLGKLGAAHAALQARVYGATGSIREQQDAALGAGRSMSTFQAAVAALGEQYPAVQRMATSFNTVSTAATDMGSKVGASVRDTADSIGSKLNTAITQTGVSLTEFPGKVASAASSLKTSLVDGASSAVQTIRNIPTATSEAASALRSQIGSAATDAGEKLKGLATSARDSATSLGSNLKSGVSTAVTSLRELPAQAASAGREIGNGLKTGLATAVDAAKQIPSQIGSAFREVPNVTRSAFSGVGDAVSAGFSKVGSAVDTGIGHVSRFTGALGGIAAAGGSLVKSGIGGLVGALGGPWGLAITAGVTALSLLSDAHSRAEQAAANQRQKESDLAATLDDVTGAATNATRELIAQSLGSTKLSDGTTTLAQALAQAGINSRDYLDATTGNIPKLDQLNGTLHAQARALIESNPQWQIWRSDVEKSGLSIDTVTDAALGNTDAQKQLDEALKNTSSSGYAVTTAMTEVIGPLGEVGRLLGNQAGSFRDAQAATEAAGAATQDFGKILGTLNENNAFLAIKNGTQTTELAAKSFDALGQSAAHSAQQAGQAAAAYSNVDGGAAKAAATMQQSRDAFIQAATGAGVLLPQAEALATQIGLIPAAAETIFRTNATGVAAEMITLGAQINAVPANKDVIVSALTDEARAKLQEMGFTVTNLPDGTFKITANTDEARAKLNTELAAANSATAKFLLDAENGPANGKINASVANGNSALATMTLDGNPTLANGKITQTVTLGNGSKATLTLDANPNPATGKVNGIVAYGNGQTTAVTVTARDNASSVIDRIARPRTAVITVITEGASSVRNVTGTSKPGLAQGGIVSAYHDGGIAAFANGGYGTFKGRNLTPMKSGIARFVSPNTFRVVGDRLKDDEAYIPINRSARSQAILAEAARRMGYSINRMTAYATGGFADSMQRNVTRSILSNVNSQASLPAAIIAELRSLRFDLSNVQRDIHVSMVANNPIAETTTDTVVKRMRTLNRMGAFG